MGQGVIALGIPGGWGLVIVLLIVLVLFAGRIPRAARSLGQVFSSFRRGMKE